MTDRSPSDTALPGWTDLDRRAVDTARCLAMDAVQKVGNGHPGTAMALAPAGYLLFQRHLRHDPADPSWLGRDRFVLSMGHSSLTLYVQLFLSGYDLTLQDLQSLRTWGSRTPGHPEHGHTAGVETTTGPLGQGVGNAVGLALAQRRVRGLLDPEAPDGESPFDWSVFALASDGDLEEGVSAEASSLAGTQRLGRLTLVWDDNHISIEDDTRIAFTEDVAARYAAYGWHVQQVKALPDGDIDVVSLDQALAAARRETGRPSFIRLRSHIAWPAPHARDTGAAHGSALGADEVAATKVALGLDPSRSFDVPDSVLDHAREHVRRRAADLRSTWDAAFDEWRSAHPDRAELEERLRGRRLPPGWDTSLPTYPEGSAQATRVASGDAINALAGQLPELWGGSADLAGSNNTMVKGEPSALPTDRGSTMFPGNPHGRNLHFGVREHAMGSILNGIVLEGHTRPYGATFLVFSDYMRPAVRLAALMRQPVVYVWTHDSIGLGEDGPTHQPVEHLMALRTIPGLTVLRPADANETVAAWRVAMMHTEGPVALALTRQKVPVLAGTATGAAEGVARGGYVLAEASTGAPTVLIIATGSEVQIACSARLELEAAGVPTRVVSLPSWELFAAQAATYREQVLPKDVAARVAVEAGVTLGWRQWVGDNGRIVGLDHFGASADAHTLFEQFDVTEAAVVAAARESLVLVEEAGR
jgi:transketolase